MLRFEREVGAQLLQDLLALLPYRTGQSLRHTRNSPAYKAFREFIVSMVDRGDFESIVEPILVAMNAIADETGYHVVFPEDPEENIEMKCHKEYELKAILASMLLIAEKLLLAMTLYLGCNEARSDIIDRDFSLRPLVYPCAWTVSGHLRPQPMTPALASECFHILLKLLPPRLTKQLLDMAGYQEMLECEVQIEYLDNLLTDEILTILRYVRASNPREFYWYRHEVFSKCILYDGEVRFNSQYRLEVLAVEISRPHELARAIKDIRTTPANTMARRYLGFLLSHGAERVLVHTLGDLGVWSAESINEFKKWSQSIDSSTESAIVAFVSIGIPASLIPQPDILWSTWMEHVSSLDTSPISLEYFCHLGLILYNASLKLRDTRRTVEVATKFTAILPVVLQTAEEKQPVSMVGLYLFMSKFCPHLLHRNFIDRALQSPPRFQNIFLRTLYSAHDFCGTEEFIRLFHKCEHVFIELLCRYADTGWGTIWAKQNLKYGLELLTKTPEVTRSVKKSNLTALAAALMSLMGSKRGESMQTKSIEFMVSVLDSGAASGAFLDTLQDMLSALLDDEASKLLDPQHSSDDIEILRYLLELRQNFLGDRNVRVNPAVIQRDQDLRCGFLIRVIVDKKGPDNALTCLRVLQSSPVYTEDMDFVAKFVEQREGALNTPVHVRKHLGQLLARQEKPTYLLIRLFYSLREFFHYALAGNFPLNITTALGRALVCSAPLMLRSSEKVEAQKTVTELLSMAFSKRGPLHSLFEIIWGSRISIQPHAALEYIKIIWNDFVSPFNAKFQPVEGLASMAGTMSWLVDVARDCTVIDIDLFVIVEKVVSELSQAQLPPRAILPALRLSETVAKHQDLVPKHKALGLKTAVKVILEYCHNTELTLPALCALRAIFQDYALNVAATGDDVVAILRFLIGGIEPLMTKNRPLEVSSLARSCVKALCAVNLDSSFVICRDLKSPPKPWLRSCIFDTLSSNFVNELGQLLYESRHATLVQYLTSHHDVFLALCETCSPAEVADFCDGVCCLWASHGREVELAELVADRVISQSNEGWELFRHNSTLARIFMDILRSYLQSSLAIALTFIQNRLSETEMSCEEAAMLIIEQFQELTPQLPGIVRRLLLFVRKRVAEKFPGFEYSILRTIVLLRIVCPFILEPVLESPSSKTGIFLRNVANQIQKLELVNLIPLFDMWTEYSDTTSISPERPVPSEDYLVEAGRNVHMVLHRHAPEILHILRAKGLKGEQFMHSVRLLGPPVGLIAKGGSAVFQRRQRALATLGQFKGIPCKFSTAKAVSELRPDISSSIYWFYRMFRAAMAKNDGPLYTFYDHTACLLKQDIWDAYIYALRKSLSSEFQSKWEKAIIFNYPFELAYNCEFPTPEEIPMVLKTSEDYSYDELSYLDLPKEHRESVQEFGKARLYEDIPVLACGKKARFNVHLGDKWIQFVHKFSFGCTNDVFHVDDLEDDGILMRGINVFEIPRSLQIEVEAKKRIHIERSKASMFVVPDLAAHQAPGILLFLCLLDLCSDSSEARESAFKLVTLLPQRAGLTIESPPWGPHQLFISSVVEMSSSFANLNPDLSESFLLMFAELVENAKESKVSIGARIAVPWLTKLSQHPECDTIILRLLRVTSGHRSLVEFVWPVILADPKLAPRMLDVIISSVADKNPVDGFVQAASAYPAANGASYLLGRLYSMLSGDVLYSDQRWWSAHPDWSEIEAVIVLLSHIVVATDTEYLADFSFLILVFAGVGTHRLRTSIHRICTNIAASKMAMASRQSSLVARISTLLYELQSSKGNVLFGVQLQMIDWTCDSCSDFSQEQADVLNRIISELCTAVSPSYAEFSRVRRDTYSLLVRFLGPTFPALQRRCILGLHGIHRFQMPDRIPERLLSEFSRILRCPVEPNVAELYMVSFLHTFGDTVECLSDHTVYAARFFWLALVALSTGYSPLRVNALVLVQRCLKIMDSWGAFYHQSMEDALLEGRPRETDNWFTQNYHMGFQVLPREKDSFHVVLAELLVLGLQNTDSQAATLDVCETILSICENDERVFVYMLFVYLTTQNPSTLMNLPFFNDLQNDPALVDTDVLIENCTNALARRASSGSPYVLMAIAQGCKITGLSNNMQFAFAGPRLLDVVCRITCRKTIQTIAPLLRPTLQRLLQLEEPEMNRRLVQWTLVVFARDSSEREQLPELLKEFQALILHYNLRLCVDGKYNLHSIPQIKELKPENSIALANFVAMLC